MKNSFANLIKTIYLQTVIRFLLLAMVAVSYFYITNKTTFSLYII